MKSGLKSWNFRIMLVAGNNQRARLFYLINLLIILRLLRKFTGNDNIYTKPCRNSFCCVLSYAHLHFFFWQHTR